jgi:hypothetical protein
MHTCERRRFSPGDGERYGRFDHVSIRTLKQSPLWHAYAAIILAILRRLSAAQTSFHSAWAFLLVAGFVLIDLATSIESFSRREIERRSFWKDMVGYAY